MTFTTHEKEVLKALVSQEKKAIASEEIALVNSPVLSSIYRMKETDIPFLKNKELYLEFLSALQEKL